MYSLLLGVIYLAFISLGLPDAMLGAAWPSMQVQFGVPVSYMGIVATLISACTVLSSLLSDRINRWLGTARVTVVSTGLTALALLGFGFAREFWQILLLAIPYGLGAGSIDAALNNYVAIHYESRHMSWLHCMWGLGAATGPVIMGWTLAGGLGWNGGYFSVALIQILLTLVLLLVEPLWQTKPGQDPNKPSEKGMSPAQVGRIPGAWELMVTFFCYCGLEQTAGQWASSYFVLKECLGLEEAAGYAGLFYLGLTLGRALSGFVTLRLNDGQMIRLGQAVIGLGIAVMLLPLEKFAAMAGLTLIGLGCAPIYPCIIHSTPGYFGADRSQAVIGVLMASAYVGNCLLPPLFGFLADLLGAWLLPVYLLGILTLMTLMHRRMLGICGENPGKN